MSITSFSFWMFLFIGIIVYYSYPAKCRWGSLLILSLIFFLSASGWRMFVYLLVGVVITYVGTILLDRFKEIKIRRIILILIIVLVVGELALLKYLNLFKSTMGIFASLLGKSYVYDLVDFAAPIGISYYTLSILGYVLDVYWEKYNAQRNFFKYLLFAIYFPVLTSGPIIRYDETSIQLYKPHKFNHINVLYGIQRILWGLFKKMVVADRASIYVSSVYSDCENFSGAYLIVAILLFALQLYTDFSGCMDIVCGSSECFGIYLPENFQTPFFSENVSEFWRRWHITMGTWFKDYLLYPILKSDYIQKLKKVLKSQFGKKVSKEVPTYLGLAVVWLSIGVWHGGSYKFILASGILPGFYLIMGEVCRPFLQWIVRVLHINTGTQSYRIFCMVRTFLCLCTSWVFVKAEGISHGFLVIKNIFKVYNPEIFFNGALYELGLSQKDFNILFLGVLFIWGVGILHVKNVKIREKIHEQNMAAQWLIMLIALFAILIFGIYGPAYDASDFIYKNF